MQQKGRTKDGNPQVRFHFSLDYNGKRSPIHVCGTMDKLPAKLMVTNDGAWVNFDWDGEKWIHEKMKDEELATSIIELLILGFESKPQQKV